MGEDLAVHPAGQERLDGRPACGARWAGRESGMRAAVVQEAQENRRQCAQGREEVQDPDLEDEEAQEEVRQALAFELVRQGCESQGRQSQGQQDLCGEICEDLQEIQLRQEGLGQALVRCNHQVVGVAGRWGPEAFGQLGASMPLPLICPVQLWTTFQNRG